MIHVEWDKLKPEQAASVRYYLAFLELEPEADRIAALGAIPKLQPAFKAGYIVFIDESALDIADEAASIPENQAELQRLWKEWQALKRELRSVSKVTVDLLDTEEDGAFRVRHGTDRANRHVASILVRVWRLEEYTKAERAVEVALSNLWAFWAKILPEAAAPYEPEAKHGTSGVVRRLPPLLYDGERVRCRRSQDQAPRPT